MSETFHQLIWTASFDFQMLGENRLWCVPPYSQTVQVKNDDSVSQPKFMAHLSIIGTKNWETFQS